MVGITEFFQKHKKLTDPKLLNNSVCCICQNELYSLPVSENVYTVLSKKVLHLMKNLSTPKVYEHVI